MATQTFEKLMHYTRHTTNGWYVIIPSQVNDDIDSYEVVYLSPDGASYIKVQDDALENCQDYLDKLTA